MGSSQMFIVLLLVMKTNAGDECARQNPFLFEHNEFMSIIIVCLNSSNILKMFHKTYLMKVYNFKTWCSNRWVAENLCNAVVYN